MFFQSEPNTKDKGNKYIKKKVRYRKIIETEDKKLGFLYFGFFNLMNHTEDQIATFYILDFSLMHNM